MGKGILWNGKYFLLPEAASKVDSSGLNRVQLGGDNTLVIVGEFVGLVAPKTLQRVGNPATALALISPENAKSKEFRQAIRLAFDPAPGSEIGGASNVYLVGVNPSTRGSISATKSASQVMTLNTYLYGLLAGRVKAKIYKKENEHIGQTFTASFDNNAEEFVNIYRKAFSVEYTGGGSTCTMTVDTDAGTVSTTCSTGADSVTYDLATYSTVGRICEAFNATGKYDAVVLGGSDGFDSTKLDGLAAGDIKAGAVEVTANLQEMIDTINFKSSYFSATRSAELTVMGAPDDFDWTYATGGADGTTVNQDWQDAFDLIKAIDAQQILTLSSTAAIHLMGDSHVEFMSGLNGKSERRQFTGGVVQSWSSEANRLTAIAALKLAANTLNSDRTMLAGLGCTLYNEIGVAEAYPAYITAAAYAGMAAGSSPVMPLTNKYIRVLALEVELRNEEAAELVDAGVAVPIPDRDRKAGFVISRQVTTWNQSDDLYRYEFSVGRGADYIAKQVRTQAHAPFIGKEGSESSDLSIVNKTNGVLSAALRDGYIRSYDASKTQLRVDGTIRYVDYSAVPILPINWIFGTYHLEPVNFTIALG